MPCALISLAADGANVTWLAGSPDGGPAADKMPEVSGDLTKRLVAPVIYGVLSLELAVVTGFAAAYSALDFRIYMWGGHAVTHDTRLYQDLAYGHWFKIGRAHV